MSRIDAANIHEKSLDYRQALLDLLYQLADDELVVGHRSSEWLGLAPDLEEDIAFSSIAQDEIGHSAYYFELLSQLGEGSADYLAFARSANERYNARMLERTNGDWASAIVSGYFYNTFEQIRMKSLCNSNYLPLQQGAQKILKEERYHFLHLETWFKRLAIAGGEAKERLEKAVADIWRDLPDLFSLGRFADELVREGIFPLSESELYREWEKTIQDMFCHVGCEWPGPVGAVQQNGRLKEHTNDLADLLETMTEVYRLDPAANW
jgi:ring-1,2-phenylacetyl-CoA epoxidase subunit PaaC